MPALRSTSLGTRKHPKFKPVPDKPTGGLQDWLWDTGTRWDGLMNNLEDCMQDASLQVINWQEDHGEFTQSDFIAWQEHEERFEALKAQYANADTIAKKEQIAMEGRVLYTAARQHSMQSCTRAARQHNLDSRYMQIIERHAAPHSLQMFRDSRPSPGIPNCVLGLRYDVVRSLKSWFTSLEADADTGSLPVGNPDRLSTTPRIYMLQGEKRAGKSVLLHSLGKIFWNTGYLAASYVFTSRLVVQDFRIQFVPTIVHEIVRNCLVDLKYTVENLDARLDLSSMPISTQTNKILVEGYRKAVKRANGRAVKLLLIFDGLDDCDPRILEYFLDFMATAMKGIPHIHFIIGSSLSQSVASSFVRGCMMDKMTITKIRDFDSLLREWQEANPPQPVP